MNVFEKVRDGNKRIVKMFGFPIISYAHRESSIFMSHPNNELINIPHGCKIEIFGERNRIVFLGKGGCNFWGTISIGAPDCSTNDCLVEIGEGTAAGGCRIRLMEDSTKLIIGNDCMLADNLSIWGSDTHAITDTSGEIINCGKFVEIGSHVWIGTDVTILKNTKIPSGTIVGAHSVVSGCKIKEENCIIAGNSAKVVKTNVTWHRERPKQYLGK